MSIRRLLLMIQVFLGTQVTVDEGSLSWGGAKTKANGMMSGVLGIIATAARLVGIGLAAVGVWHFIHALQESDGQGKGRAVLFIVAGVAMFLMKTILTAIFKNV